MREIGVVDGNPGLQILLEIKRERPLMSPHEILFESAKNAFGIGIAFWVVPGGENLLDMKLRTGFHEGFAGGLAAIVRDELWLTFMRTNTVREPGIYSPVKGFEPIGSFAGQRSVVADDFFGKPVDDDMNINPTPTLNVDLGHVGSPVLIGDFGPRFGSC